jgi:hypothetical protein
LGPMIKLSAIFEVDLRWVGDTGLRNWDIFDLEREVGAFVNDDTGFACFWDLVGLCVCHFVVTLSLMLDLSLCCGEINTVTSKVIHG